MFLPKAEVCVPLIHCSTDLRHKIPRKTPRRVVLMTPTVTLCDLLKRITFYLIPPPKRLIHIGPFTTPLTYRLSIYNYLSQVMNTQKIFEKRKKCKNGNIRIIYLLIPGNKTIFPINSQGYKDVSSVQFH